MPDIKISEARESRNAVGTIPGTDSKGRQDNTQRPRMPVLRMAGGTTE